VPWARDAATSFLPTPEELRQRLAAAGFEAIELRDTSPQGIAWFERIRAAAQAQGSQVDAKAAPPGALHLIFGEDWGALAANMGRNLVERRILVFQVAARRPV